jgi:hypothetical protein
MNQFTLWLLLFGGIVVGPAAALLGYKWFKRQRRRVRRRFKSKS